MTNMVTTVQQMSLFPGARLPLVTPRPAVVRQCPILKCYTDLTPAQAQALAFPGQAVTVTRNALRRAGWLDEDGTLTESGADVLRRAQALLAGAHPPAPALDVPGGVRFRIRRTDQWRAVHLKCLLYLARSPETAWRYLTGLLPSGTTLVARYNAVTERPEAITVLAAGMPVNPWTLKVQVAA